MTNRALKPCPFCGGEARTMEQHRWWVFCQECMCELGFEGMDESGRYGHYDTEADAIAAWNSRAERVTDDEWEIYQRSVPATEENMAMFGWVRERTCHNVKNSRKYVLSDGCELFEDGCSICNSYVGDGDNYCANCDAKVVEE